MGDDHLISQIKRGSSISIHVPRVGDDQRRGKSVFLHENFYPRPPRGGRLGAFMRFLYSIFNFYPRPPRGGRPSAEHRQFAGIRISIHVPRVGDDWPSICDFCRYGHFYPRPPRGGRPLTCACRYAIISISIHVPRVGDDKFFGVFCHIAQKFLSTSPAWGTTTRF